MAIVLLDRALLESQHEKLDSQSDSSTEDIHIGGAERYKLQYPECYGVYKTTSGVIGVACAIASLIFEGSPFRVSYVPPTDVEGIYAWLPHEELNLSVAAIVLHIFMSFYFLQLVG